MTITISNKYAGLRRGHSYKLLGEGKDYKCISVQGRPFFVPNFVFGQSTDIEEEEEFNE